MKYVGAFEFITTLTKELDLVGLEWQAIDGVCVFKAIYQDDGRKLCGTYSPSNYLRLYLQDTDDDRTFTFIPNAVRTVELINKILEERQITMCTAKNYVEIDQFFSSKERFACTWMNSDDKVLCDFLKENR